MQEAPAIHKTRAQPMMNSLKVLVRCFLSGGPLDSEVRASSLEQSLTGALDGAALASEQEDAELDGVHVDAVIREVAEVSLSSSLVQSSTGSPDRAAVANGKEDAELGGVPEDTVIRDVAEFTLQSFICKGRLKVKLQ